MNFFNKQISEAAAIIKKGGIVAFPPKQYTG
jgi:tRNA A37 threonylcarbamoyladenosine synthetase subunit TsaC/SUA5/YrdC